MVEIPTPTLHFAAAALLLPIVLIISLLVGRVFIVLWWGLQSFGSLPLVVQPLNFEHSLREFVPNQRDELLELPSRLRDYISEDSEALIALAPGPITPVAPQILAAPPDSKMQVPAALQILNAIFPGVVPGTTLFLSPRCQTRV